MNLAIVIVSVEDQIHIKVLHTLLELNAVIHNSPVTSKVYYCNNNAEEKAQVFREVTNSAYEKTIWLEIDTHIPVASIANVLNAHKNEEFVVFSSMENRVDWDQFIKMTKEANDDTEPLSMRGIVSDLKYTCNPTAQKDKELIPITRSELRSFIMTNKRVNRKLKNKFKNTKFFYNTKEQNGTFVSAPHNLCRMMKEAGVQMKALVDVDVTRYFKHEHVGSLMDTHGTTIQHKSQQPVPTPNVAT